MLNSIRETRAVKDGLHNIILEIPEKDYLTFYETISEENAHDILKQYLNYHQDDAVPSDVRIEHNKNAHTVNIYANLHYLGNEKTEPKYYTDDAMDE
ncbi:hypothetical protein [Thermosediminibacter oceani]|uniref:Uncharacterized protein n=1 Tax=Thermosediminibacter oceani (strain ATCC BAA-1034 / DSM 16646 / JW/IW-1228P) TaxID=555079 RepID=D9S2M0_THEOJ|nr:hypothetical protein [Thermosediminibacter oceani]ADL07647.1 conserved hypothetical protein [Thermosediminibacter oceani DSM 16646]